MKRYTIERRETTVYHVVVELPDSEDASKAEIIASVGPVGRLAEKEYVVGKPVIVDEPYSFKIVKVEQCS